LAQRAYDLAIVGGGIVGMAHALAASRLGLRSVIVERDHQPVGASIRNFGFITVTGQARGQVWQRARRSRDVWLEIAKETGIAIETRGLGMIARRREARDVLEAFLATEMAGGCRWLDREAASEWLGPIRPATLQGVLISDMDLRVESRVAIPLLARWLEQRHDVAFRRATAVHAVTPGRLFTSEGEIEAGAIIVCPGDDLVTLFPEAFADVTRCKLQMLRLAAPVYRLPATLMSDLSLVRYLGYAELPEAAALRRLLDHEQPDHLAHGIHLIVAQGADGSLIVGDSHHYSDTPDPFTSAEVERLILEEFAATLGAPPPVLERWSGTYASADRHSLVAAPMENVRLVTVTSGTGASTAFALAEDVIGALFDRPLGAEA